MYDDAGIDRHPTRIQLRETIRTAGRVDAAEIAKEYRLPEAVINYHLLVLDQANELPPETNN